MWLNLQRSFPKYEKSPWSAIYTFKIACRSAQFYLIHDQVDEAIKKIKDSKQYFSKEVLRAKETQSLIAGVIDDVIKTVNSCGLKPLKESAVKEVVLSFKTKGK
jgi:hypothetical protein